MKTDKFSEAISSSYGKYFITIKIDSNEWYTVWGEDATDDNQNKLLLDKENNLVLFKRMPEALAYVLQSSTDVFDHQNMRDWAKANLRIPLVSDCTYDIDLVRSIVDSGYFMNLLNCSKENSWTVLSLLHIISDYAYQINDEGLLNNYRSEPVSTFADFVYDNYFWTIPKDELAIRNANRVWQSQAYQFKQNTLQLIRLFITRFSFP